MPSKPYITEGELYIAFEDLKARLQSLIDTGVITKNPVFDSATIRSVLMINDEGCLIDGEGNAIIADKQSTLVSGENIKTINGASILGPGNLVIEGGGTSLVAGEGIIITEDGHIKVDLEKIASKLYVDSEVAKKSEVTVSDTGTTTNTVQYITVDGTEYKLAGGSEGPSEYIKTAAYDDNTLVLLDQDDTPIVVSIPTVPTNVSSFTNDAGYLTEHQSLVDYVKTDDSRLYDARTPLAHTHTTSELTDWSTATANFLTEHQSLAGYATETYVNNHHDTTKQDVIDGEHKLDYSLLSNTPVIPTVPTNISAFTNDAGYLTEHQSLDNYVTLNTEQVITGTKTFTKTVKLDIPDVDYDSKITATGTVDTNAGLCLTVTGNLTHKESGESTDYKPVIRNIGTPQKANDAATKDYVDSKIKNTIAYLVALNEDYSIYSKSADLTWAKVNPMLTDRASAACLDVSWSKTDFSKNSRFYLPLNCSQDVNDGPLVFDGYANIGGENKYIIAKLGKDNSFTLSVTDFITDHSVYEVKENKVNSIIDNSSSTDKYPNTKAVYEEFVRKPKVIWETDGGSGLLGINASAPDDTKWQLTDLDFSPYAFVRCYIKQSNRALTNTTDANYRTPAVVVTIPLDSASKSTTDGWYFGASGGTNVADRNVHFQVICAIDETKTKFQVVSEHSIYGTALGGRNDDGRYCYKIEGCYADEAESVSAAPTGGVTSITAGQGLLGGTITSSGVINLDDDYVNDLIATYMTEHYENGNTGSY